MSKIRKRKTKQKRTIDQQLPNPKKKIEHSNNKKKIELANPKNKKFWTDKANYAHKVFCQLCKWNHVGKYRLESIICHNCNEAEHFAGRFL